jgi:hypothetical protein
MANKEPVLTIRGALMVLNARLLIDDDADKSGIAKKYYISKEETRRRIEKLRMLPLDMELPGSSV